MPVTLRSAPGAAAYLGAAVFRDIVSAACAEHPEADCVAVLDCGGDPGFALAALRAGLKRIRVDVRPDVYARLADIARQSGATLEDAKDEANRDSLALDLLDCTSPLERCRVWLSSSER